MRIKRSRTEAVPEPIHHHEKNFHIKRTNSSIVNHELLRLQICEKNKTQQALCDYFMKYIPLAQSGVSIQNILDAKKNQVRLIKNSNKIYFGGMQNNLKNGNGILIDNKGKIYEGNFQQNNKTGHGVQICPNGNVYIGSFVKNKKHGKGQFYWFSLSPPIKKNALYVQFYDGKWWGGLPDGLGSHQKSKGDIYDGQFKNGLKHGKGEQYFFNGDFYKGEYVNGLPQGYGIYQWDGGGKYQGDFKQGLRSGQGIWVSQGQTQQYKGHYLMDKKNGYGEYSWLNNLFLYKGNFQNDLKHGYGELFKNGQQQYKGEWIAGKIKYPYKNVSFVIKTPKGQKLTTQIKLKTHTSPINQRLRKDQLLSYNKSLSKSKSPKSHSKSQKKISNTLVLKTKKNLKLQNSNKRPISVYKRSATVLLIPKYAPILKSCIKKNYGCNANHSNLPVHGILKKSSSFHKRSLY